MPTKNVNIVAASAASDSRPRLMNHCMSHLLKFCIIIVNVLVTYIRVLYNSRTEKKKVPPQGKPMSRDIDMRQSAG